MIWWIVAGALVLGLGLLVLLVLPVLRRLAGLRRAMARAQQRAAQAQGLQDSVEQLQERLAEVAVRAAAVRPGTVAPAGGDGSATIASRQ
jgi:type VI protein secretion system component VasK